MKEEESVNSSAISSFEALVEYMQPFIEEVEAARDRKAKLSQAMEDYRNQIIELDRSIANQQDRLNDELQKDGKANPKTLDSLAVLRHKRDDVENTLFGLRDNSKLDAEIKAAELKMARALEAGLESLKAFMVVQINGLFFKVDQLAESYFETIRPAIAKYGVCLDSIDRQRLLNLKGIKPANMTLLSHMT